MTGVSLRRGDGGHLGGRREEEPALAGLQESPRPQGRHQPPGLYMTEEPDTGLREPTPATEWRNPSTMGTPASIANDLLQHQTSRSYTRKRASANIFHGVALWQLHRLFHGTGDAQADERAQLVWECAENQCITQALQKLHRRQRKRRLRSHLRPPEKSNSSRLHELQHFSHLCIEDYTGSGADVDSSSSSSKNTEAPDQTDHSVGLQYRKKREVGASGYLHQLHQ